MSGQKYLEDAHVAALHRRQSTLIFLIEHLLSQKPPKKELVEKKLRQFDQLINEVPAELETLSMTWKEMARSFWKQYAQVLWPTDNIRTPQIPPPFVEAQVSKFQAPRYCLYYFNYFYI